MRLRYTAATRASGVRMPTRFSGSTALSTTSSPSRRASCALSAGARRRPRRRTARRRSRRRSGRRGSRHAPRVAGRPCTRSRQGGRLDSLCNKRTKDNAVAREQRARHRLEVALERGRQQRPAPRGLDQRLALPGGASSARRPAKLSAVARPAPDELGERPLRRRSAAAPVAATSSFEEGCAMRLAMQRALAVASGDDASASGRSAGTRLVPAASSAGIVCARSMSAMGELLQRRAGARRQPSPGHAAAQAEPVELLGLVVGDARWQHIAAPSRPPPARSLRAARSRRRDLPRRCTWSSRGDMLPVEEEAHELGRRSRFDFRRVID
mgnify:CR=1 FL=1